jgi:hypothetical protein
MNKIGLKLIPFLLVLLVSIICVVPSKTLAHDHEKPNLNDWYLSLKVPSDGLALLKGSSCCNKQDCKQRVFTPIAPGIFSVIDENTGNTVIFTEQMRITDQTVIEQNPYFQLTTCIYNGKPVCYVFGKTGG